MIEIQKGRAARLAVDEYSMNLTKNKGKPQLEPFECVMRLDYETPHSVKIS
jgi:hypothetical protein